MTQIPASDRIVGRGAEAGTSGGCPPRAGFRRADPLGQMRMKMPGGDVYRVLPFAVAGLAAVVLSGLFSTRAAALPTNGAGDQWIAKQYSEVLGRAPGASGWGHYLRKVHGARCTSANLHRQGVRFFRSREFRGLRYTNAAKTIALYRGILNRDPNPSGFRRFKRALDAHRPIQVVADRIYASREFALLKRLICRGGPYYWGNPYTILTTANSTRAYAHIPDGSFAGGTSAQLQAALDRAAAVCGTVYLDRGAVVTADRTITIPNCVRLATGRIRNSHAYLLMGRIIRTSNFMAPVIRMMSDSKLNYVWVDGNRNLFLTTTRIPGVYDLRPEYDGGTSCTNGTTYPSDAGRDCMRTISVEGNGVTISNSRVQDSLGGTNVKILTGYSNTTITGNLFTSYATSHYVGENGFDHLWSDGISVDGNNSTIAHNQIIDATDASIVLFGGSSLRPPVNTKVFGNQLLQAGNSAFAAIDFDPFACPSPPCTSKHDYSGTTVSGNTLWTSTAAHYHIDFTLGTRAWFGTRGDIAANGTVENNLVPRGRTTRTSFGLFVDAMENATVWGNQLRMKLFPNWAGCGLSPNSYTLDPADSSGSVVPSPTPEALHTPTCNEIGAKTYRQSQETLY